MAQFTLNWFSTALIINPNAIGQTASYRQKSVGGSWLTTGFTPANNLSKTASTVTSPVLGNNIVWEFRVQALCTVGGPELNDNGVQEGLKFACLAPIQSFTTTTAQIILNVIGLDITKAAFTLRRVSDGNIVSGPTIVLRVGNSITHNVLGLTPGTEYFWQTVLYATVNGAEVNSGSPVPVGLGAACNHTIFETDPVICSPVTGCDVSSTEL